MISPSRWLQVTPAACRNVARPGSCAASASQVARSRLVSSRGRPVPPASARASGLVMVRRRRAGAAGDQVAAGERRRRRRVRGEPLDHRRVQQHLRRRLQAQPGA
jgi:hypothetical protein